MREIKFRARKSDTLEWVIGSYHYSADGDYHYILRLEKFLIRPYERAMYEEEVARVDEGTVGQYTSLKDKNGKDIYEGDIISLTVENVVIKFKDGGFGWDSNMASGVFIGFAGHNHFESIISRIQVIGNIHENPELLKN